MQERRALVTDVHERRLHPRQHPDHPSFIYVSDDAAAARALYIDFLQHAVLDDRDAGFLRRYVYQDFFAHILKNKN